ALHDSRRQAVLNAVYEDSAVPTAVWKHITTKRLDKQTGRGKSCFQFKRPSVELRAHSLRPRGPQRWWLRRSSIIASPMTNPRPQVTVSPAIFSPINSRN